VLEMYKNVLIIFCSVQYIGTISVHLISPTTVAIYFSLVCISVAVSEWRLMAFFEANAVLEVVVGGGRATSSSAADSGTDGAASPSRPAAPSQTPICPTHLFYRLARMLLSVPPSASLRRDWSADRKQAHVICTTILLNFLTAK